MPTDDDRRAAEVHRLYWETDASVGAIAERLGISRRALYRLLRPSPAGARCHVCGGELVYPNRSAREAGRAECANCGHVEEISTLRGATAEIGSRLREEADRSAREAVGAGAPEAVWPHRAGPEAPIEAERALRRGRALAIGGAALAGLAVGAIAGLLISRR